MATKYYTIKGKVAWAKVFEPDEYLGTKKYKVNFFPDNAEEFRNTGIQVRPKTNSNPDNNVPVGTYYTLSRPISKEINGEEVEFGQPDLYDANGDQFEQKIIGNGSTVEVRFCVYDTRMGKGHRLEGLKVLELVVPELSENKEIEKNAEPSVKTKAPW